MECTDCREPQQQIIARFLIGLMYDIAKIMELQPFDSLDELIQLAYKAEWQCVRDAKLASESSKFNSKEEASL